MANYKWPDVYPTIKDLSGVVATNSVTTCAYVGEAEFGPINKPTFLSTLKDYTNIFGALNSAKYGYAGYSLAVASESINSHYFVRVVKAGKEGAHDTDDAMYASVKIPKKGSTKSFTTEGYYVEDMDAVLTTEDPSGLFTNTGAYRVASVEIANGGKNYAVNDELTLPLGITAGTVNATVKVTAVTTNDQLEGIITAVELINTGTTSSETISNPVIATGGTGTDATFNIELTNTNVDDALIIVANNPNNLKLFVTVTDSTVNENRAQAFTNITYVDATPSAEGMHTYTATMTGVPTDVYNSIEVGSEIEIVRVAVDAQAGIYTVKSKTSDENTKSLTFDYESTVAPTTPLQGGKVSKYPDPSERTFKLEVKQQIGKVTSTVESYNICTTYPAKDHYGNSTFVEDVVNGSSDYVRVYVNPNLLKALPEGKVLETKLTTANTALGGGQAGGKPTTKELLDAWDLFKDRSQTTISLLMNSGYTTNADAAYQNKMLEVAEYRRDCFCLFDIPVSEVEADDAIDWRKNIFGSNSYRGALSSPWVRTYDAVQGRGGFVMCPSAFIAKLIGQAGDPWHAPAGPNRGIISSSTVSPTGLTQMYDSNIGGTLYADNQINCIIRDASAGYVNWGQRTLQQKPSALDRINVARTVIYIETILRDAARWHLFENNTPYERMQITLQFSQFLDTILSADGIAAYQVICDTSNNTPIVIENNQLVIDVILTPVYAAESIILNTTITGADAAVTVTSSAN